MIKFKYSRKQLSITLFDLCANGQTTFNTPFQLAEWFSDTAQINRQEYNKYHSQGRSFSLLAKIECGSMSTTLSILGRYQESWGYLLLFDTLAVTDYTLKYKCLSLLEMTSKIAWKMKEFVISQKENHYVHWFPPLFNRWESKERNVIKADVCLQQPHQTRSLGGQKY